MTNSYLEDSYDWTKCICPHEDGPQGDSTECSPECDVCNQSYQDWLSGPGDW